MKHIYVLLILICTGSIYAQTTITYPQRVANHNTFFTDGGGNFDDGTDRFGMWANFNAKQSVAWRNFTQDGTAIGTTTAMSVGDSFTITLNATRAYGVIGIALLSSPSSMTNWADRINNYAVQINLPGESTGSYKPWEIISNGGTVNVSSINGSTTYADFKFKFTLNTATTMTVSMNDGAETFNITLNNQNITGYSVYISDDWNGTDKANIYWKPTTAFTYNTTLNTKNLDFKSIIAVYPNPANDSFTLNKTIAELNIFDITGKHVKSFKGTFESGYGFNISDLPENIYVIKSTNNIGEESSNKLVKL